MDPFVKKVKTYAERDELLKQAREDWNRLGAMSFLVATNEEEYLEKVASRIQVDEAGFVPPAPLSTSEQADFERRLTQSTTFDRIFANRRTDAGELPPLLQKMADEEKAAELEQFLAPGRRANQAIDDMIQNAIERAVAKTGGRSLPSSGIFPKPVSERAGLLPVLKAAAEFSENSDLINFLTAWATGDQAAMRKIARELAA
jgi:hypothetical protein